MNILNKNKSNIIVITILLLLTIIISLSFKTNSWNLDVIGVDASVFVSIGEKMHDGKIPYKDIFDHKGPLLYLINYIGTITDSYIFLYIIETVFLLIDIIMLYKISLWISNNKIVSLLSTVFSSILFPLVLQGGNFAEEYTLPFILIALYIFLKPQKKIKDYVITGFFLGAVVLLKINMIPIWCVGYLFVIIDCAKNKNLKGLLQAVGSSLLGFVIVFVPIFVYLMINGAFNDFIYQYIIFNLKYSVGNDTTLLGFVISNISMYFIPICMMIVNICQIIKFKDNKEDKRVLIIAILFTLLTVFVLILPKNPYLHYTIGLIPCYIIPIVYLLRNIVENNKYSMLILTLMIICIFIFSISSEYADRIYECEYKIVDRLKQISNDEADVLVLGNSLIINLLSQTSTECKYIYQYPIEYVDEKIKYEVGNYIYKAKPDIIVFVTASDYIKQLLNRLIEEGTYYVDSVNNRLIIRSEGI